MDAQKVKTTSCVFSGSEGCVFLTVHFRLHFCDCFTHLDMIMCMMHQATLGCTSYLDCNWYISFPNNGHWCLLGNCFAKVLKLYKYYHACETVHDHTRYNDLDLLSVMGHFFSKRLCFSLLWMWDDQEFAVYTYKNLLFTCGIIFYIFVVVVSFLFVFVLYLVRTWAWHVPEGSKIILKRVQQNHLYIYQKYVN